MKLTNDDYISLAAQCAVGDSGRIDSNDKHCGFDCFGSGNRHTHAYMTRLGEVEVTCGCFWGTFDAFVRKVEETHAGTVYEKQYKAMAKLIKIKFKLD